MTTRAAAVVPTKPLEIGVIGCGRIGARRASLAAGGPGTRLRVVADIDDARARQVGGREHAAVAARWEDVIADDRIDAVVVATTHEWLAPICLAALAAGKHVLCEKPMSLNAQQAAEVAATARVSGRTMHVGFNHRHHPAIRRAHALARDHAIGDLLYARCRYGHGGRPGYEAEWRMDPARSGGGELLDQGIHAIDLFRWFLGELCEAMGAVATWVWAAPVEDNAFALFRSSDGRVASLHASWTQWKNLFSFEVGGTQGTLTIDGLGGSYGVERLTVHRRRSGGAPLEETQEFPGPDLSWQGEWEDFVATIVGHPIGINADADDGLAALRLVDAVYEASRRGATVAVR